MVEERIQVANEDGLHTRPANRFVKIVKELNCKVTLRKGEREASGSNLLKIMKLGVVQGDEVLVTCDGEGEYDAMSAIRSFLTNGEESQ